MKNLKKISRTRGFTLIELLVVISIIGLLSSIVLASLVTARDKAQQTAYRQYLGQVLNAVEIYVDNGYSLRLLIGSVDSAISSTDLGNYIKTTPAPSFIHDIPYIGLSADYLGYSCENSTDDYFIYFNSTRGDLNFRTLLEDGVEGGYFDGTYYYYCASISLK